MLRAPPPLRKLALRFALVGIALLGIGSLCTTAIVRPLVPVLGRIVNASTADFTLLDAALERDSRQPVVKFRANLSRVELVAGHYVYPFGIGSQPRGWYEVALTTGSILQYPMLLFIIVLAWPGTWRELGFRSVLAIPVAMVLVLLHVAITVPAELWFPIHDELASGAFWPLLATSRFLMGGGGLAIATAFAALIIALGVRILRPTSQPASNSTGAAPSRTSQVVHS